MVGVRMVRVDIQTHRPGPSYFEIEMIASSPVLDSSVITAGRGGSIALYSPLCRITSRGRNIEQPVKGARRTARMCKLEGIFPPEIGFVAVM